jgi:hypothetical protein
MSERRPVNVRVRRPVSVSVRILALLVAQWRYWRFWWRNGDTGAFDGAMAILALLVVQ